MRRPDPQLTPRGAIVNVYGAFVRRIGGWMAIADLIVLLADLGVDEQAARSTIARLKRLGLLHSESHHASAGYAAGHPLLDLLGDGDARIFHSRIGTDLVDDWVLVVFSVPERERDQRHLLRTRLAALGCGPLAPGVWIAPGRVSVDVRTMLQRLGLEKYTAMFKGSYVGSVDLASLVGSTWDVGPLARHYASFATRHGKAAARWQAGKREPRRAFIELVGTIEGWRRLAYEDPGLPDALAGYAEQRRNAHAVFVEANRLLGERAMAHVESTVGPRRLAAITAAPLTISDTAGGR